LENFDFKEIFLMQIFAIKPRGSGCFFALTGRGEDSPDEQGMI